MLTKPSCINIFPPCGPLATGSRAVSDIRGCPGPLPDGR